MSQQTSATSEPALRVSQDGGVTVWQMNLPHLRNPLSVDLKNAFTENMEAFASDPAQRVLIVTGKDAAFCAGGDLRTMDDTPGTMATRERMHVSHAFVRRFARVEKPIIMAVNGAAVGAGASLAMLGDIIVASESAYFAAGFPRVGVMPDLGLLWTLPRVVGLARAKDFVMSNRTYTAQEASQIGMVSRVLPDEGFLDQVRELAAGIARGPGVSIGMSKLLMDAGLNDTLDAYLLREEMGQAVVFGTEDFLEGTRAFREKRRPMFKGR
ncbi:MAG: enoyl-CoA hydratase/isomerase family protein [Afipia sp.]